MTNKKVLAFDLDGTLAISKSAVSELMAQTLVLLLDEYELLVISGGGWEQFEKQLIDNLNAEHLFHRVHLMPTCGTHYRIYKDGEWSVVYDEPLTELEVLEISEALESSARDLGYWEENTWGEIIENRRSQVTFSALGQQAPPEEKYKWDPDHSKKKQLVELVLEKIPHFDVKAGGTTSIDITKPGIDKAYGLSKFIDHSGYTKEDIIFYGDHLYDGGNDYPVKQMGIDSVLVKDPDHTHKLISDFLNK